ncbi:MAG: 5'/3'-nucleotidase SurE [Acidimicrobiia bacterium]|nr:5'/3'-nucleotidase SurE [Acidimicrobiia bacterium]MDH3397078.1 5'/3'-nucleotidase SurE [Acidimicrobiia bacterium]MDH5615152.1 5'/3'-nucleotidase SurE [Acidimicrobiia bacterium]
MGYLLLTNDDGVDSPALLPFARALDEIAPLKVVVPAEERSWVGKAITRFDEIRVERTVREGIEVFVADGYPADCTQLGVHSLFGAKPDMVLSGINIGLNQGLGFLLSSGTVGAAAEGWIAGLPAVAFSTGSSFDHRGWAKEAWSDSSRVFWEATATLAVDVLADILRVGYPDGVDVFSVNFPENASFDSSRRITSLAKVGYDNIFREHEPGRYIHDFNTGLRMTGDLAGSDVELLRSGVVTITPIQLAHTGTVPDTFRAAVERG